MKNNEICLPVAIVTGAANGIGRGIAEKLAEQGAIVLMADIDEKKGPEIAAGLRERSLQAAFIRADVSSPEAIRQVVDAAKASYGRLD